MNNALKTFAQWQTALSSTQSKNPRPFWERGDHASGGWGIDLNGKTRKLSSLQESPHPAYSATFSLMEKAKNLTTSSHSNDQIYKWNHCEQKRLEIMNAKGSAKLLLEFRIIRQNTGAIHKQRVLVQRVEDEEGNLIGLRGAEMDLGIVEEGEPLSWSSNFSSKPRALAKSQKFFLAFKT